MPNRCEKHGVFSGSVGCPWCKAEAESRQTSSKKATKKGVTILSKTGQEDPLRGVSQESKDAGGTRQTTVEVGTQGDGQIRTSYGDRRHS